MGDKGRDGAGDTHTCRPRLLVTIVLPSPPRGQFQQRNLNFLFEASVQYDLADGGADRLMLLARSSSTDRRPHFYAASMMPRQQAVHRSRVTRIIVLLALLNDAALRAQSPSSRNNYAACTAVYLQLYSNFVFIITKQVPVGR